MYHLKIHTYFAAAHNLINYQGDCENLHGHNWKVELEIVASQLNDIGIAIDFKQMKKSALLLSLFLLLTVHVSLTANNI